MARTTTHHFIDWLKAIGVVLIVYGHLAGSTVNFITPPIEVKQIGVACFLLVLGYALAQERRPTLLVVARRLFTLYLLGIAAAVLISLISVATTGRAQLSNFLPFLLGANVLALQNGFPANPTTWYVATYLHIVLLWALLGRRLHVRPWMLACSLVFEVVVRVVLADTAGPFLAYMALPNWLTVVLWGTWLGQQGAGAERRGRALAAPGWLLLVLLIVWPGAFGFLLHYPGFPFEAIGTGAPAGVALLASLLVTILYVGYADCLFRLTRGIPAPGPVLFLARHTLVIFILHMPLFYLLVPLLEPRMPFWPAKLIELLICLPGLGLVSVGVMRVLRPEMLLTRLVGVGSGPRVSLARFLQEDPAKA